MEEESRMKRVWMVVFTIAVVIAPLTAQDNWRPLFNGKTLDGWYACKGTAPFTVEDGAIVGRTVITSPNSFLCTKETFGDFILEYEVKVESDMNSGVQVRSIPNTVTAREARDGWKLLWDGKTTAGWRGAKLDRFPASGWEIRDGLLTVLDGEGRESAAGGDIVSASQYANFELIVEFNISKGANSGVKYFVDTELNKGEGSAIGCEFQILDDEVHPDAKAGMNGNRKLAGLYDLIPPRNVRFNGVGEWNRARIVVKGPHVEHWLNGFKTVEYERGTQMWRALVDHSKYTAWPSFGEAPKGHILLQDHGNRVSFRSIKIKEIQ